MCDVNSFSLGNIYSVKELTAEATTDNLHPVKPANLVAGASALVIGLSQTDAIDQDCSRSMTVSEAARQRNLLNWLARRGR